LSTFEEKSRLYGGEENYSGGLNKVPKKAPPLNHGSIQQTRLPILPGQNSKNNLCIGEKH